MARDRVYTSSQYREVVDGLKKNDVLGLNIVEGKDIFMLAVALGLDNPTQLKNKIGLFLNTALKMFMGADGSGYKDKKAQLFC